MNKQRRKDIADARKRLSALLSPDVKGAIELLNQFKESIIEVNELIEQIRSDEQDSFDNLPESLQEGEKGQSSLSSASSLEEAGSKLDEIDEKLGGLDLDALWDELESEIDEVNGFLDSAIEE